MLSGSGECAVKRSSLLQQLGADERYAASDEYLADLSDEQLRQTVDLSWVGLGTPTIQWILSDVLVGHAFSHAGEIACLKGLQGSQGYIH